MAGTATPHLAAEVSRAGGLGSLGLGASNAGQAAAMMAETCERLGSNRYGVNLFCHRPAKADPARETAWLDYLRPSFAVSGRSHRPGSKRSIAAFLRMMRCWARCLRRVRL
ncbi:nitronate monooxygenase [Paracoccus sp. J56]|uniref:nitronate monooxygenase n=1 Tax=Paracoccus sp. J56 TaxID=935850 RepID=UPI00300C333F